MTIVCDINQDNFTSNYGYCIKNKLSPSDALHSFTSAYISFLQCFLLFQEVKYVNVNHFYFPQACNPVGNKRLRAEIVSLVNAYMYHCSPAYNLEYMLEKNVQNERMSE